MHKSLEQPVNNFLPIEKICYNKKQRLFERRAYYDKKAYKKAKKELVRLGKLELSFARGVVVPRPVGNAGGIKTLGVAVRRDLAQKGFIELKGQKAKTAEDNIA